MNGRPGSSWRRDGSGVSPVIGVILLIALAVMLSAIVFLWTGGLIGGGGGDDDGDRGGPARCSQGDGNFIRMDSDLPRQTRRDQAEYRMMAIRNGTQYLGAESNNSHEGTSGNDWTEFDWEWSPETHEDIQEGDSMKVDDRAESWAVGDRFEFTIRDGEGVLVECEYTWQTKDKPEKGK